MAAGKLTPKQAMFVKEYLVDLNASQAAIRAGYSEKTAGVMGYENLNKPQIAAAVQSAMAERSQKLDLSADDVLQSILSIRGMAVSAEEFSSALKANELLGRHLNLWKDVGSKDNPVHVVPMEVCFGDED